MFLLLLFTVLSRASLALGHFGRLVLLYTAVLQEHVTRHIRTHPRFVSWRVCRDDISAGKVAGIKTPHGSEALFTLVVVNKQYMHGERRNKQHTTTISSCHHYVHLLVVWHHLPSSITCLWSKGRSQSRGVVNDHQCNHTQQQFPPLLPQAARTSRVVACSHVFFLCSNKQPELGA
jgi:hypothetical protein